MKFFYTIVLGLVFSTNVFASRVPVDSVKFIDMLTKVSSLINVYNQEDCPKDVVDQLCQLYKEETGLSELSLPFASFNCMPIKVSERFVAIKMHPDLNYDDNRVISMKSKDDGCLAFLDIFPLFLSILTGTGNSNDNVKNKLLQDIISNQTGQPRWLSLKSDEIDIDKAYDKQVKIYTANSQLVQNCNADTIYVCSFSERKNIGYYSNIDSANRDYNTIDGYKMAYKVVLTRHNHFPVYLFLFCKEKDDKALNKYLDNITKSIRFKSDKKCD